MSSKTTLMTRMDVVRWIGGLLALFAVVVAITAMGIEPYLEGLGKHFFKEETLLPIFLLATAFDSFPSPLSIVPLIALGFYAGKGLFLLWALFSFASITGGIIGYAGGRWLGIPKWLSAKIEEISPGFGEKAQRHGAWFVVVFGILPLPYSLSTWGAGAFEVPFWKFFAASCIRAVKVAAVLGTLIAGQTTGGVIL